MSEEESKYNRKRPELPRWLLRPTELELGVLYVLLGIYIATGTDATSNNWAWERFILYSLLAVMVFGAVRISTLLLTSVLKRFLTFWARWAQFGFVATVLLLIFGTNLDLALRVRLSERELYGIVQNIQRLTPEKQEYYKDQSPLPIGLFNAVVYRVDPNTGTIWFETGVGGNIFGPPHSVYGGIVYCQEGLPEHMAESTYQHLYGPWWRWLQDM